LNRASPIPQDRPSEDRPATTLLEAQNAAPNLIPLSSGHRAPEKPSPWISTSYMHA
jgi:hypothetical protein